METPDLNLQARAQYALGTLLGRMADSAAAEGDWKEAAETYRRALRGFESALRLDPADEDARINHELARARLEEARRLLEQEPKPEPEQEPEPGEDEGEQEEEPEPGPPGDPDDPAETPDTEPDPGPDEAPDAAEPEPGPPGDPDPRPLGEPEDGMTEEEARVILDALREREEAYRERARLRRGEPEPVEKDW